MLALLLILSLVSNREVTGTTGKGLGRHSEIHEAKNLIDTLSSKLHLNLQTYQNKYNNLKLQSNEVLTQSGSTKDEIRLLNKLKELLNDLTNKSSTCEKFYTSFGFTTLRQIMINTSVSLPKDYTVTLQGKKNGFISLNFSFLNSRKQNQINITRFLLVKLVIESMNGIQWNRALAPKFHKSRQEKQQIRRSVVGIGTL